MKRVFAILFMVMSQFFMGISYASDAIIYPKSGTTIDEFVPKNWVLEKQISGDLNKDRRDDVVLVVRKNDPDMIIKNEGFGTSSYNKNERHLIILLRSNSGYSLADVNKQIVPIIDNPMMDDPLDITYENQSAIKIEKGVLKLRLYFWASAGSWSSFSHSYTFRMSDEKMRLIGFDRSYVHRASGESQEVSINFLSRKMMRINSSIEVDNPPETWSKIAPQDPIFFSDIGDGLAYIPDAANVP